MKNPPNILFLMSDEHRADVAGFAGNKAIQTPTLDWLAEDGYVFNNAYTPSPTCVPGRQCMMAGQLPKTAGCEGWFDLQPGHMTFARRFSEYAYHTTASGKLHHFGFDMMQGWSHRTGALQDMQSAAGFKDTSNKEANDRYAQNLWDVKWSEAKEVQRAGAGHSNYHTADAIATQCAMETAREYFASPGYDRPKSPRPLMLKLSLLKPHYPYQTSSENFDYYLNRVEPFLGQQVSEHPYLSKLQVRAGIDASERELRRATAAYYGMIHTIDQQYAQMLDLLKHVGQNLDDWIIVYTSDHGEMLGEHGVWEKQKFYEGSVRVPLIIRWPNGLGKSNGKTINQNVSLCDLFATLCDMAEIPTPDGLDSRSLVPLIKGDSSNWRNEALAQYGPENYMIKQDDLKYSYYGSEMPEVLFDLKTDPKELTNFIGHPNYAQHVAQFRQRLADLGHGPNANPNYKNVGYA